MKKFNLVISICCLLFAHCTTDQPSSRVEQLPYYKDASFTPHWISDLPDSVAIFHKIPSFQLVNQHGQNISNEVVSGKIYVADFFFTTCPGICPKMTLNMKILQEEFRQDSTILLLSHSVTPEIDSVAQLAKYAKKHGINSPNWHLLTGNRKEIYNLGRNTYFIEEDLGVEKTDEDFLHTENFVLIDQQGHIRGIFSGLNKTSIAELIADIYTLKKGNSAQ
ncbi:SCO family protein [Bacteroidia bacterium]|nr:SCO family protein [Bacteroidia bacterium]